MAGSGYQQDSNQLTQGLYRVIIDTSSSTYYPLASATTTQNGGINPYDWDSSQYTNATSITATQATYLAQGNLRWSTIIDQLDSIADCRILDVVITGGGSPAGSDATAQNTGVAFTVEFDRDSFILGEWNNYLKSQGQSANGTFTAADGSTQTAYTGFGGTAITTNLLAIKDLVATAISASRSRTWRVYSPSQAGDSQVKVSITTPNSTYSNIYGTVTVTQISGTTLAGSPL
jgi:hypothetical protein